MEDRQLLGYLDVTYGCDINEPYDLLVRPGLPFRKYAEMCIRDRVMLVYLNWALTLITFVFLGLMLLVVKGVGGRSRTSFQPVSYTHLDVYKRQV